jgi:hypothetical protein
MYGIDPEKTTETKTVAVVHNNGATLAPSADPMAGFIERAALDPNFNVEKFDRLLQLQRQDRADAAERAFNVALLDAQAEMPAVFRAANNDQTHSRYATLEAVSDVVLPVIQRHGFGLSFGTADCPLPLHYRVTCKISHVGGHTRQEQADVPADTLGPKGLPNKTATHGFGSAMSYGRRYLTLAIFNVVLTNDANRDDDGNAAGGSVSREPAKGHGIVTEQQVANITDLLEQKGATGKRLLAFFNIESFAALPSDKYATAVSMIKAFQPAKVAK